MAQKTYREGKKATLFPTVKSSEDRATSIFLAVLKEVAPLRKELMSSIGIKVRKRKSTFDARVHPEFSTRNISKDIPDGIITLDQDKLWSALIEVKIEKSDLNQDQLERYLKRVKSSIAKPSLQFLMKCARHRPCHHYVWPLRKNL